MNTIEEEDEDEEEDRDEERGHEYHADGSEEADKESVEAGE